MGSKQSKEESEDDYLLHMHERGFHHILEVIFLSLPAEDVCSCKQVSPEWRQMIEFYQNSPSQRAKNILQSQISQAWRAGNPKLVVSPSNFHRLIYKPSFGGPKTIAADDEHLAIAGLPVIHGQVTDGRIYVLNVQDLSLFKVIPIEWKKSSVGCEIIELKMNRNYLIGHIRMHTGSYAWLQAMWVWDRKRKYSLCQKSLWDPDKMSVPSIIIPNFDSYTFFSGDLPNQLMEKSETPFTVKLVYKQMGMSTLVEFEATKDDRGIPDIRIKPLSDGSGDFLFWQQCRSGCNLSRQCGDKSCWIRTIHRGCQNDREFGDFKLLGLSENFVVVASKRDNSRFIETFRLCDGEMEHELDLTEHFWSLFNAQIASGRIAVQGLAKISPDLGKIDVIVAELKTGSVLFRCGTVFEFLWNESFYLDEKKILTTYQGQVYSAIFWQA